MGLEMFKGKTTRNEHSTCFIVWHSAHKNMDSHGKLAGEVFKFFMQVSIGLGQRHTHTHNAQIYKLNVNEFLIWRQIFRFISIVGACRRSRSRCQLSAEENCFKAFSLCMNDKYPHIFASQTIQYFCQDQKSKHANYSIQLHDKFVHIQIVSSQNNWYSNFQRDFNGIFSVLSCAPPFAHTQYQLS